MHKKSKHCKICDNQTPSLVCSACDAAYKRKFDIPQNESVEWNLMFSMFWAASRSRSSEKRRYEHIINTYFVSY